MAKYECLACGYVYDPALGDPDAGIAPGTLFEELPSGWVCPLRPRRMENLAILPELLTIQHR